MAKASKIFWDRSMKLYFFKVWAARSKSCIELVIQAGFFSHNLQDIFWKHDGFGILSSLDKLRRDRKLTPNLHHSSKSKFGLQSDQEMFSDLNKLHPQD